MVLCRTDWLSVSLPGVWSSASSELGREDRGRGHTRGRRDPSILAPGLQRTWGAGGAAGQGHHIGEPPLPPGGQTHGGRRAAWQAQRVVAQPARWMGCRGRRGGDRVGPPRLGR